MARDFPCPACGFLVFDEAAGSYDICNICGWEDDPVQLTHPRMRGGANHESLVEAQLAVLTEYPIAQRTLGEYQRDPEWRPLTDEEAAVREDAPRTGRGYFDAACVVEPGYYWRKPRE